MKKFFTHNGSEQEGPFDIEELKNKKISKDTMVWFEGLDTWTKASNILELKEIIFLTPPLFVQQPATPPPLPNAEAPRKSVPLPLEKKKSSVWKTIRTIIIIIIVVIGGLALLDNWNRSGNNHSSSSYQEKVMTVEEIEKSQPTNFLEASGTYNETFWGDNIKINGFIKNNATVANFKDVIIAVTFYSRTKSVIKTENYAVYDYFTAHSNKEFELKVPNYKGTSSIGLSVSNATPY